MSALDDLHAAEAALEAALAAVKTEPVVLAATPSPEPAPVVAVGTTSLLLGHIGEPPVKGHDY